MRSLLLLFTLLLQSTSENTLTQLLITRIRSSSQPSWIALANILETVDADGAAPETAAGEGLYDSARRRALRWLSADAYALSLLDDDDPHAKLLERYALATLYYSTSDSGWSRCGPDDEACPPEKRFLSPGNHLDWEGLNGKNDKVTWIDLNSRNLSNGCFSSNVFEAPALPLELSLLTSLELLWLHSNPLFCGTIPPHVTELPLQSLSLHSTKMSGSLPSELYGMESLSSLRLYKSRFSGNVTDLSRLKNLKWAWIHGNEFTGSLSHVGNMTFLEGITLHGNGVSTTGSGLCDLMEGNLKYLWVDCREGSVTKDEDGEWRVVEGVEACECCTRCFPKGDGDAVAAAA
jgi:hypothetical protein